MKKLLYILPAIALALTACNDDQPTPVVPEEPCQPLPGEGNRTVLVYMAADNDLYKYAFADIHEMESVWSEHLNGNLLVFLSPRAKQDPNALPSLYRICKDVTSGKIDSELVKIYPSGINATDANTLSEVIADVREMYPAKGYGLVLWSHATGWIPWFANAPAPPIERSFGKSETYKSEMNVDALADALPADTVFDFIYADVCYMGTVETAYELRKKTNYFIASVSETLAEGAPYHLVVPHMMAEKMDDQAAVKIAQTTFEYFENHPGTVWDRANAISVVKTSELENLAQAVGDVITGSVANMPAINEIQRFAVGGFRYEFLFFDLTDFITRTWADSPNLEGYHAAMGRVILYDKVTDYLYGLTVKTHCGMTTHIPQQNMSADLNNYYNRLQWSEDSGMNQLLF